MAGACELFGALAEAVTSLDLTNPSQGLLPGYNQTSHRATIAAVSKNVPARARPACRSTTAELTSETGLDAVLRGCADRYHRRGQLYPQSASRVVGLRAVPSKRLPRKGCAAAQAAFPPQAWKGRGLHAALR